MTVIHFQTSQRKTIDLGEGLIMRWSTAADTENLQKITSESFRRLLMSGKSSTMKEYDYALVEDTQRHLKDGGNPVIACVCLQRRKAYYGSVDFYFGMPEFVATDPTYRNRGLIRKLLLEMVHPESEARGDVLQVIPGILNFYRQFGYEYGLCSYSGFNIENADQIPPLDRIKYPAGEEPFTLRLATFEDLPFLNRLSSPENRHANAVIGSHYAPETWQYFVHDLFQVKESRFDGDRDTRIIIETKTGNSVGYTMTSHLYFGPRLQVMALDPEAKEVKYLDVAYPVLRQLFALAKVQRAEDKKIAPKPAKKLTPVEITNPSLEATTAEALAAAPSAVEKPLSLSLCLHEKHPLVVLLGSKAKAEPKDKYPPLRPLYTRISSYPNFILAIAPELESRLSKSALAGVSGCLLLDFFRSVEGCAAKGLEITFDNGKIVSAVDWTKPGREVLMEQRLQRKKQGITTTFYEAAFPPLVFTMLVTGHQSLNDLYSMYGDVAIRGEETKLLLNTLFPKVDHHLDIFYF
ncbi:hypothetical protein BGZ83_006607 [Gryganskiella cystojenkinii]|nr:hypothetical protein BGZ83_006607 [Gryganskiella cystojenkinii]